MGAGQMWMLQFQVNDQSFSVEPPQRNVGAREAFEFMIRFTPRGAGEIQGIMTVTAIGQNGDAHAFEVQLNGLGIGEDNPEIEVDPEEVQFEIVTPEQRERFRIRINSIGEELLEVEWELDRVGWIFIDGDRRDINLDPGGMTRISLITTYDFPENGEYVANLTINSNDPERPEIIVPITMTVDIPEFTTQTIELEQWWNMISTNRDFSEDFVDDEGPDMELIFADIAEQISLIKDQLGGFCAPPFDYWGIDAWESDRGYQVRTLEETELEATGSLIPWDREIFLHGGWNIVPYYPVYENDDLALALEDLIERNLLEIAKDGDGRFITWWDDWGWPNPWAVPGQSYMVKVTQNCRFRWAPEPEWEVNSQIVHKKRGLSHFDFDLETAHSSNNMSVVIRSISADNTELDGSEVGCFTEDSRIAGAAIVRKSDQAVAMPVWGDEILTTDENEGFRIGERLTFRMWDATTDEEYPVSITVIEGENKYSENGILICDGKIERTFGPGSHPEQFAITAMYPNPFNSNLTVSYTIFESTPIQIGLYSIDGRLLKSIALAENSIGSHTTTIDASDLSASVYIVKVGYGDFVQSNKVVLIK